MRPAISTPLVYFHTQKGTVGWSGKYDAITIDPGISLGKVHYCLTGLIEKGYIKATRFKNSRNKAAYSYMLIVAFNFDM